MSITPKSLSATETRLLDRFSRPSAGANDWRNHLDLENIPSDADEIWCIVKAQLSPSELDYCVVYLLMTSVPAGSTLEFPHVSIAVPWEARVAFFDLDPLANFGHPCRYVLINSKTGETSSINARFPPFRPGAETEWRVIYRAPGVPEAALGNRRKQGWHEEASV